jgi:hypothetical protein
MRSVGLGSHLAPADRPGVGGGEAGDDYGGGAVGARHRYGSRPVGPALHRPRGGHVGAAGGAGGGAVVGVPVAEDVGRDRQGHVVPPVAVPINVHK